MDNTSRKINHRSAHVAVIHCSSVHRAHKYVELKLIMTSCYKPISSHAWILPDRACTIVWVSLPVVSSTLQHLSLYTRTYIVTKNVYSLVIPLLKIAQYACDEQQQIMLRESHTSDNSTMKSVLSRRMNGS